MESVTEAVDPTLLHAQHRVGTTLRGKWQLDRLLGLGGMAAVYAATHRNGTRGAIKLLHSELSANSHVRSRFLREGYAANRVDHPGVVRVLDDDVAENGSIFVVMELLDGESLEERRVRLGGKLEIDEVLAATDQLLDVLAAAHDKGVIHRDIKPENVFLTRDGVVKVLDFGIARLRELSTASSATRAGVTLGTPAFMSPEHARGLWDEVDARSDLWSVGALMFSLVTGRTVHEGRTTNEVLLAAMSQPAPPVSSACQLPEQAEVVINRALAFDREKRWSDAHSMQEAVRRAYHSLHGAPISSHRSLTVPPTVPNRTLPSADLGLPVAASPGTGPAVASGRTGVPLLTSASTAAVPRHLLVAGAGIAAAMVVFGVLLAIGISAWRSRYRPPSPELDSVAASTGAPATQAAPAPEPRAVPPATSAPSAVPVVALEDLPSVGKPAAGAAVDAAADVKRPPPVAPPPTDWKDQRR